MDIYKNKYLLLSATAILLMIHISCGNEAESGNRNTGPMKVEGYAVRPEVFTVSIRATGELLPNEEVELKSPVSGNVLRIHFREGQQVRQGDLLVELDARSWSARKKGLEGRLAASESDLERRRTLLKMDGVSQEEVEQLKAEVTSLKAQIEELDVMIDLAHIRAPFSGRVGMRDFSTGAWMSQGELITRLVQSDKLKINFSIPARYSRVVGKEMPVTMISSSTGDTARAFIYAIDPMISSTSRSLPVRAIFDNPKAGFIPGDFVQIILEVSQNGEALLVPAEAVIPELNNQVVYIFRDGKAVRTTVKTGARTRDRIQITSGLEGGDVVLTTGLMVIRDGDPVEVTVKNPEGRR
ncbi:MAG: efflux RND transporter periplasmic adaptor subunit [Bacteroidales bacterium]